MDWRKLKKDFPILDQQVHGVPLVYFDNAATTQKPRAVIDSMSSYYLEDNSNVHRGVHELSNRATSAYESARKRAAEFINAGDTRGIIFTRGTTESINLVAQAWGDANFKPGDRILLTEMEHHSNIVPWQLIAERTDAELIYVPVTGDDGRLDLTRLEELLSRNVKLFAFTHVSNTLGTINPAAELCAMARKHGVTTLVDAAQSAGHMPVDVAEIGCDFLAFSGHKVCGPTGIGVLYVKGEMLEKLPPWQGGGEMISSVDFFKTSWNEPPYKFEAGTPNIAGAVGLHAAMDYLDGIGRRNIFEHDRELGRYAWRRLSEIPGIRLLGPADERIGLVSFLLKDAHAHDVTTFADQRGFALRGGHHCNQPLMRKLGVASTVRSSFYFYNDTDEIDRLVDVLIQIQKFFAG
ncbi:MAG: cysteine desulfurase [Verrucomicrobia bacterium]|nr:cysteine desulfurase [Verrucomicrobiota bacterium]MCF7709051.1 cysteine desulfurase [Verrucomicrobiota bacterium]